MKYYRLSDKLNGNDALLAKMMIENIKTEVALSKTNKVASLKYLMEYFNKSTYFHKKDAIKMLNFLVKVGLVVELKQCEQCNGVGHVPSDVYAVCPDCKGTGFQ